MADHVCFCMVNHCFLGMFVFLMLFLHVLFVILFRKQLKVMEQCEILYIDGTFKTAPQPFMQLVTISGLYRDCAIPLVFALVTGKTVGHYRGILQVRANNF